MKKIILINFLFILIFALLAEIFSRVLNLADITGVNSELITKNVDFFENSKNVRTKAFGETVYTDQYGFRVPYKNYLYKKDSSSFLILGDSTAFGVGIREEQTFILSYAYNYDSFANEDTFISKLNEIGLLFHKEKCLYKTHDAYKIIIYENMCPIDVILQQL